MASPNTKLKQQGGKSQMRVIDARFYNPEKKAPSRRDLHRLEVARRKEQ